MFVLPTFSFGVVASTTAPLETFDTATLENGQTNLDNTNILTLTVQPSRDIPAGDTLTITGLTSSQTVDGSVTLSGANAAIFGSAGSWTQSTGTLVLTVDTGQTLSTGSDTVITFNLTNPATVSSGVSGITLSSSGFTQASLSGTFLNTVDTFNVTTRDTEANILASTPTNPSGEVNIAFGTDTYDFYIYSGGAWYIYNYTPFNQYSVSFDGTNDYIDCGGASDFSFNNGSGTDSAFSISAWVKFDNITRARAVSKDNGTSSREYLFGTNNNSKVNMIIGAGSHNLDIQNNATINTSDWFHIVATYDGSKSISGLKVYVNADASNLTDVSVGTYSGMPLSTGNLNIGRFGKTHSVFDGLVDEVAVFSKELTALEVTNIYSTGVPNDIGTNGLNLDPLGWWRMGDNDGSTGTTITDQGSGGNNGTLNNTASPNGIVTDVP